VQVFTFTPTFTNTVSKNQTMQLHTNNKCLRAIISTLVILQIQACAKHLFAQVNYQPGYIVQNTGDTLRGWIDYRSSGIMSEVCNFRRSKTAESTVYTPKELRSFQLDRGKAFVAEKVDASQYFLEVLYNGCLEVYALKTTLGDTRYFARKKDTELTEITYQAERTIENEQVYLKESAQHIIALKRMVKDQPEFFQRIDQMGSPNAPNLVSLAIAYQKKACPEQVNAKTIKNGIKLSLALEGMGGIVNYVAEENIIDKSYPHFGVIAHLGNARDAGKIFLRTGFLLSTIDQPRDSKGVLKVPIQVEYVYPSTNIKPHLAAGISLYSPFYQTISINTGVNIKVRSSSYISLNYDLDVKPLSVFFLVPSQQILGHTFAIGYYYKFGKQ